MKRAIRTRPEPTCELCGAHGVLLYENLADQLYAAPGSWNLKRCPAPDCGLIWLDPMPLEEDLPLAYRDYFTHDDKPSKRNGIAHRLYRLLLALSGLAHQRTELRTFFLRRNRPGRLLEVGCGAGDRLAEFRSLGWEVEGQEIDPPAAERAMARGLPIHLGALPSLSLTANTFDAAVMNHVIEHVHDPLSLLCECHRVLKPGGRLAVVTPNVASLGHRCFGSCWMPLDPPRHLRLFSPTTLQQLIARAGFRDCQVSTTAANAQFVAEGSLAIRRAGRHQFGPSPGRSLQIQSLLFQLRATLIMLVQKDSGEECFLTASK